MIKRDARVAWVLLAGEFSPPWRLPRADEMVIAADGGIQHAAALGGRVDFWLGDFDSTPPALVGQFAAVPRAVFPRDKDETDFELLLHWLRQECPLVTTLFIVGGAGGESDHEFGNLWVGARFPLAAVFFAAGGARLLASGGCSWRLRGQIGAKVSVFALTPLTGVTYRGLQWPAENWTLAPFYAVASRNALAAPEAIISWQTGTGLVFLAAGTIAEQI